MPSPMTASHTHLPLLALHILHNTSLTNVSFYVSHPSLVTASPSTSAQTSPYQTFFHSYSTAQLLLQPPTFGTSPTLVHLVFPLALCSNPPLTSLPSYSSPSQADFAPATITTTLRLRKTTHHPLPRLQLPHPSTHSQTPMQPSLHSPPPAAPAPLESIHIAFPTCSLSGPRPQYTTLPFSSQS